MLGMDGWGWGWGMGIIHGLLWWAILILGIIVLVRLLGRDSSRAATAPPAESRPRPPEEALRSRRDR